MWFELFEMLELLYTPLILLFVSSKSGNHTIWNPQKADPSQSPLMNEAGNASLFGDCHVDSPRLLIYHNNTDRCYPIFSQGYCKNGEQLIVSQKDSSPQIEPKCERTICYEDLISAENSGKDLVPFGNTCMEVGIACPDKPGRVGFSLTRKTNEFSVKPTCVRESNPRFRGIGVPPMRCSPGTYRAMSGHCQPPVSFDDWDY